MSYPNIKSAKLTCKELARIFGYKNANSFRYSTAYKAMMNGIEEVLIISKQNENPKPKTK